MFLSPPLKPGPVNRTFLLGTIRTLSFGADTWSEQLANVIRAVKADQVSLRLQNEFYERARHPLDTKQ